MPYHTRKLADLMPQPEEDTMTTNERMAQFNQDWARVDNRFTEERLRVFNLIEHYKQGNVPPFAQVAKQSAIPLARAYRHWRSEQ